jgi:8-oxo-dGTP pyrophosphatase MutT (NUDIX family)
VEPLLELLHGIQVLRLTEPPQQAALARLRSYLPPPTNFFSLPLPRRASVLILLYADKRGELRVVLTMRAKTLSSYAGQAALPGGKADSLQETPYATARREAYEEIGLPLNDGDVPAPFRIRHLCQLPMNLARTNLGVRPCVAFLEADPTLMPKHSAVPKGKEWLDTEQGGGGQRMTRGMVGKLTREGRLPTAEDVLIPRLDAKEVAAVFTAPFEAFLETTLDSSESFSQLNSAAGSNSGSGTPDQPQTYNGDPNFDLDPSAWYSGQWVTWYDTTWRMHNFYVPSNSQAVAWAEKPPTTMTMNRFRVFGMTARILVDAARVAFGREPKFEHNTHLGDEDLIGVLLKGGVMDPDGAITGGVTVADNGDDGKLKQAEREKERKKRKKGRKRGSNI